MPPAKYSRSKIEFAICVLALVPSMPAPMPVRGGVVRRRHVVDVGWAVVGEDGAAVVVRAVFEKGRVDDAERRRAGGTVNAAAVCERGDCRSANRRTTRRYRLQ